MTNQIVMDMDGGQGGFSLMESGVSSGLAEVRAALAENPTTFLTEQITTLMAGENFLSIIQASVIEALASDEGGLLPTMVGSMIENVENAAELVTPLLNKAMEGMENPGELLMPLLAGALEKVENPTELLMPFLTQAMEGMENPSELVTPLLTSVMESIDDPAVVLAPVIEKLGSPEEVDSPLGGLVSRSKETLNTYVEETSIAQIEEATSDAKDKAVSTIKEKSDTYLDHITTERDQAISRISSARESAIRAINGASGSKRFTGADSPEIYRPGQQP